MKALPEDTMEGIRRMYQEEPNKAKLARMFGVSKATVYKALGKVDPETQRESRHESMGRIAGKMTDRIEALLDATQEIPENASYTQKMVAVGILSDKVEKLDRRLAESKVEDAIAALPIPETVEAMAAALRNEIRAVQFILVDPANADVVREAKRLEVETGTRIVDAEVLETIDDVDGR